MIVPIVPHRSMWLVYGVLGGTVPEKSTVPPSSPHRPHRPPTRGGRSGDGPGDGQMRTHRPPLFGLPMRITPCAAARGTVGTVECGTLLERTLGEILHLDLQRLRQLHPGVVPKPRVGVDLVPSDGAARHTRDGRKLFLRQTTPLPRPTTAAGLNEPRLIWTRRGWRARRPGHRPAFVRSEAGLGFLGTFQPS